MSETVEHGILKVKDLLALPSLTIPAYQRPYKWTKRHITQLFDDINVHQGKTAYRLGTIVFHHEQHMELGELQNIVDGQQRTLTLMLAVQAIIECRANGLKRQDVKNILAEIKTPLEKFMAMAEFDSDISKYNLRENYLELKRLVSRQDEFKEEHIHFLLNQCEVVTFTLHDVSEAFQFFDSQNARGRDLDPHDLLKAYHLREFSEAESKVKADSVEHWEGLPTKELTKLFATYLFRIRQWARGHSARYFSKDDVHLFKGVNFDRVGHYPYVKSLRIAHHYVDEYNQHYQRKVDDQKMDFPFHLDQQIINGRRFFQMAAHYHQQVTHIVRGEHHQPAHIGGSVLIGTASDILTILNDGDLYPARKRTGDRYVRTMFDCALIYYIDKFGYADISRAIEKIFIWAYSLRIKQKSLQLATMDNHVLQQNVFVLIKEATQPSDFFSLQLDTVKSGENNNNDKDIAKAERDPLVKLFKKMNYYEQN